MLTQMKASKGAAKKHRLESQAMAIWWELTRRKWGSVCEICGEPAVEMHHFVPRSRSRLLKFDVENAVPLCKSCHTKIHYSGNEGEATRMEEIIKKKRGKKWQNYIEEKERSKSGGYYGAYYLKGLIEELKSRL